MVQTSESSVTMKWDTLYKALRPVSDTGSIQSVIGVFARVTDAQQQSLQEWNVGNIQNIYQ